MSIQRQIAIWAAVIAVFIAMLWLLKGILLPFVAGMAIAYFLDPLADKLCPRVSLRRGILGGLRAWSNGAFVGIL